MAIYLNIGRYKDGMLKNIDPDEISGKTVREVLAEYAGSSHVATINMGMVTGYFVGTSELKGVYRQKTKRVLLFEEVSQILEASQSLLLNMECPPPCKIELKKKANDGWFDFPLMEISGMTVRQNLEFFSGKSLIIKIDIPTKAGPLLYCGTEALVAACKEKYKNGLSFSELLNRLSTDESAILNVSLNFDDKVIFGGTSANTDKVTKDELRSCLPSGEVLCNGPNKKILAEVDVLPGKQMPLNMDNDQMEVEKEYQEGIRCLKDDNLDQAFRHFLNVLSKNPKHIAALSASGFVLMELGRNKEALIQYQKATAIDGNSWKPWFDMGVLLMSLGRSLDAVEALERAYKLNNHDKVRERLVCAYVDVGQHDKASNLSVRHAKRPFSRAA